VLIGGYGCAESLLEKNWGRSYEAARYNQIQNPEAERNSSPVTGLEGQVGERIMNEHVAGPEEETSTCKEYGIVEINQ
jgi:hypothetical protein